MMKLTQWLQQLTQLNDFDIATIAANQFADIAASGITESADAIFTNEIFAASFQRTQVIIGLECWTKEVVQALHRYLRSKTCCIDRFVLINTVNPGLATWWQQWQKLYNEISFVIVDTHDFPFSAESIQPWTKFDLGSQHWPRQHWYSDFDSYSHDMIWSQRQLSVHKHFLYLGGSRPTGFFEDHAKEYLMLRLSEFQDQAWIECLYDLHSWQDIANWIDYQTYWADQRTIDRTHDLYNNFRLINANRSGSMIDIIHDTKSLYDQCFASVVRETVMTQPFGCITEKTFRAFYFQQFVIPTTLGGVDYLESLGFEFDHDMFDYSYQANKNFMARTQQLCESLNQFVNTYSVEDLRRHMLARRDLYLHNSELARQLTLLQV